MARHPAPETFFWLAIVLAVLVIAAIGAHFLGHASMALLLRDFSADEIFYHL